MTSHNSATDARSREALVAACACGARPKYLHFWGHRRTGRAPVGPWVLSQWWPASFAEDATSFASAEHYMMWRKARLFGDAATAERVLTARTPAEAKHLGRLVSPFDEPTWERSRWGIVVAGSTLKFGGDPLLRSYLLATRGRVLVEASPLDRVWGIGLPAESPDAADPRRWRGLNLLGFALMEARSRLVDGAGQSER